ncbi:ATP-binding cassette subfamily B protein [Natranaerovirga pectinivora]|uniref:ATP-binding cassette subfamily B protein n=1 Tax=Natranaerovirga pectinivora TaxID=682400 RepID=A0A4V2UZJ8_9FIRM|nr:ABC transporter ATP-binding protein [Natranaerovirga pectinivora]TCT11638.1 ATP-binding cassette subfamily B protein [Natranaerovirga pectinivora]
MKNLLKYIKPYWIFFIFSILLMLVELYADLIQPAIIADIVDIGVVNQDFNYILHRSLIMIGLAVLGMIGGFGSTVLSSYASQSFSVDLRRDLFKKVQSFSFSNIDKFKTSSLITRLTSDVTQVQNMVRITMRMMFRAVLLSIGGVLMASLLNLRVSIIFVVAIPALVVAFIWVIKKGFPIFSVVQQKLDKVNGVMRENLVGARVVKAFVRADLEKNRFKEANEGLMNSSVKGLKIVALLMPAMMLILNLSIVAVLWIGGIEYSKGTMTDGQIIAYINYLTRILMALMRVAFGLIMISRAKASVLRINEVLDTEVDIHDNPNASDSAIKKGMVAFENVTFKYSKENKEPILKDISFSVNGGETVAILGATGSGKSTLVNLISRLYDVTEGKILIDGKDIKSFKLKSLRNQIGMVLQESILFSGTIKENLLWGDENANDNEIITASQSAQADEFISNFTKGYETILGQRGVNVSGGQKQRISIARALVKKPKILILDDSTSAVDMATEAKIQEALRRKENKCTTFVIAQRISTVLDADKIIVLDKGEIVAQGTHEELLKTSEIYKDIYISQMGKEA